MPDATILSMESDIVRIIKRFKFEELESAVMPVFPEISWNKIKSELVKHHNTFTTTNAAQFIKIAIADNNISQKDLKDRLSMLQLIDISWHSHRKKWYGHLLKGSGKPINYFKHKGIQAEMKNYFSSLNVKMDIKLYTHNNTTYIFLTQKKMNDRKKKILHGLPIIFAIFVGQKYFFASKKKVSSDILQAIITSTGFEKSKQINLMGKNLKSLSKMCWKRKEGVLDSEKISNIVEYNDADPERKATGIDFTQRKQRKKYAEECFGDSPVIMELLVLNGSCKSFIRKDESTESQNEFMKATWEYHSPNILALLTNLIEQRILVTPVPHYISNLMVLGENELTISNN
ncbi:uncharacterized protein LOC143358299 [Halictus rubicundus]|uniref:uncharacterized protein LOC143358299 n=1 Tax=Halictus rubicundus TaxID=77578 RepID=UPI004035EEDB